MCFSMRMTFDLLHELLNAENSCFFHCCMWQSWYSEVNVLLPRAAWTNRWIVHSQDCCPPTGLTVPCLIYVFVFVYNFYRHWHATLDGFWSIHGSPFATKQDIYLDLLGELLFTHRSSPFLIIGFLVLVGFVGCPCCFQRLVNPILSSNYLWRKSWEVVEVTHILFRIWFLQIPPQQLLRYSKLEACRKGWLRSILFDRTSILSVEQALYLPIHRILVSFPRFLLVPCLTWFGQVKLVRIVVFLVHGIHIRKEYYLSFPSLNFILPVSILTLWWSVNWLHIQYDKCTRRNCQELPHCPVVKDQWDCVLNDLEELGDKEFLVLTESLQYWNIFFLPPPPAILLFHISSDQCWEFSNSFRRQSSNLQNSVAPSSSGGKWPWRRRAVSRFDRLYKSVHFLSPMGKVLVDELARVRLWWFCFSLWSARKSKYIRFQREFFRLRLRGFLVVFVVLFVDQIRDQLFQSMRNSDPRVRTVIVYRFNSNFHSIFTVQVAGCELLTRVQFWCSLLSGQMIFSSLGKVYSRYVTGSVICENSPVSFVMKNCPTSTVVRNPASVQNLITRFGCERAFSTRSLYFCNKSSSDRIFGRRCRCFHQQTCWLKTMGQIVVPAQVCPFLLDKHCIHHTNLRTAP